MPHAIQLPKTGTAHSQVPRFRQSAGLLSNNATDNSNSSGNNNNTNVAALQQEVDQLQTRNAELMHLQSQFSSRNLYLHNQSEALQVSTQYNSSRSRDSSIRKSTTTTHAWTSTCTGSSEGNQSS